MTKPTPLTDRILWPFAYGMRLRDRFLPTTQLLQAGASLGVAYYLFHIAGGDWRHPLATGRPVIVAAIALITLSAVALLAEYEARTTERRLAAQAAEHRRREDRPRTESPYRLQVAERAVIAAAFQIERAQLPAEHPQYHDLREAVALLRRAISNDDAVHPDVLAAYRHVFGTPPRSARRIVAGVVREHGPLHFHQIATMLRDGTDGRPPLMVSSAQLALYLRDPDNPKRPATWLAPRQQGEPYQHRENLPAIV